MAGITSELAVWARQFIEAGRDRPQRLFRRHNSWTRLRLVGAAGLRYGFIRLGSDPTARAVGYR